MKKYWITSTTDNRGNLKYVVCEYMDSLKFWQAISPLFEYRQSATRWARKNCGADWQKQEL